jgi:plastocyanin
MHKRGFVLSVALALTISVGAGVALAKGGEGRNIRSEGTNYFEANSFIQSTLRFSPELISVESGGRIRFSHRDETFEPHTLSLVQPKDLPTSVDEVFACQVCNEILEGHFGGGIDRRLEDDDDQEFGLDAPGDSLLLLEPGESISSLVTAAAGTRLFYLCAIHPWMQGQIKVTS